MGWLVWAGFYGQASMGWLLWAGFYELASGSGFYGLAEYYHQNDSHKLWRYLYGLLWAFMGFYGLLWASMGGLLWASMGRLLWADFYGLASMG